MGRVAVVTGGTRGIGGAISIGLKEAGYRVAANYVGNEEAAAKFSEVTHIDAYKFDVGDFDACRIAVTQIEEDLGAVDVLVNNAGVTRDGTMHRMDFEQWNQVIQTNLGSCFNMSRCVIDGMRQRGFGRVVNIGSINGQAGQYGQVNYAAAKSGIHGLPRPWPRKGPGRASRSTRLRRVISIRIWSGPYRSTCWKKSLPGSRSAVWARPRKLPAGYCSWSAMRPGSLPVQP